MAVAFRSASSTGSAVNAATRTITLPAGLVAGDVLLFVVVTDSGVSATPPVAMTTITTTDLAGGGTATSRARSTTFFWPWDGTSSSLTFTLGASGQSSIACAAYSGAQATVGPTTTQSSPTTATTTIVCPSVTAASNAMLVTLVGAGNPLVNGDRFTPDASMNERVDAQATTSRHHHIADQAVAPGATGTRTHTADGNIYYAADSVLLYPTNTAPGAPTVTAPNGGTTVSGTISVTWTAAVDPEANSLTYDVDYTVNNGSSWQSIATGVSGLSRSWNTALVPNSTSARVRVRAFDGALYGPWDESDSNFTIDNNVAPTAPTLTAPTGGTVIDRGITLRFSWTFNDSNVGDSQSKYDLDYRVVGAGSWTTVTATTTSAFRDFAGGTFAAGNYEWRVRTYDALGLVSPYSSSGFFTAASAPATPTITAPANNSTIAAPTGIVAWSTPDQDAYQVRKVADLAGSPDTGTVYYDTGTVVSTSGRDAALSYPVNSRFEHLQVRVQNDTLWSTWASVRVQVAYSPPAIPTLAAAADNAAGTIIVTIAEPAPSGPQPAVASREVWRRVVGSTDSIRLSAAAALTFTDRTPASGVAYEYQVVSVGTTGTTAASAWTG